MRGGNLNARVQAPGSSRWGRLEAKGHLLLYEPYLFAYSSVLGLYTAGMD